MAEFRLKDLGQSELADRIRAVIGAEPFEEVVIQTPQFERTDGNDPWWTPTSAADLDALRAAPDQFLRSLGCGLWEENGDLQHWLYPGEWYGHIPAGYEVIDICGEVEPFKPNVTDDDIRGGCLAYGFCRAALAAPPQESSE